MRCRKKTQGNNEVLVPAWSSFQKQTSAKDTKKAVVGYLPATIGSPTSMDVIQAILERSAKCMYSLNLNFIFLEVDQTNYHKVLQALFSHKQNGTTSYDKLILRMGGFHVIICVLRKI